MNRLGWILVIAVAPTLAAQTPPDSGEGGGRGGEGGGGAQAQQLREQIRQRWTTHVRTALGLNDDQTAKLQATEREFEAQRQPVRARQREINAALTSELSSGAPNQERVTQLMNERQENRLKMQQIERDEDRATQGYLTPVQRARYQEERRRFQERVAEIIRHRREQRRQMENPQGARRRPRRGP